LKSFIRRLESRDDHEDYQFTLVIDTTLNSINHHVIIEMLEMARPLIDCGTLNIILLQSLTKFSQIGLDQCNGGLSIVINNGTDWKKLNQFYADIQAEQSVDVVAMRYFDYFGGMMVDGGTH